MPFSEEMFLKPELLKLSIVCDENNTLLKKK